MAGETKKITLTCEVCGKERSVDIPGNQHPEDYVYTNFTCWDCLSEEERQRIIDRDLFGQPGVGYA